ncbi:GIP [Symbiodinium sp. CCMP2456]|nr:GIP [Symbiodinium sp. CCMP2456]
MATCFRALLWCFLLCFVVMTVWAMLIVEVVSPFVKEMHADMDRDFFKACHPQCTKAVSTVMDANLLLFKTVIAGDAWGEIAVPVIQEHPATFIIFIGSSLTLVFGVLNLIVAVVVDTFAESRQSDVQSLAEEMEDEIEHDRAALGKLFARMDRDRSGKLTLSELMEGAQNDSEFRGRLRVMDIDEQDLESLFYMIDEDQSGTIDVAEFIGPLSRWAHDSKTAPRFIKYNMIQTMNLQEELYDLSVECFQQLAAKIDGVARSVAELRPPLFSAGGQAQGQEDLRGDRDAAHRKSDSMAFEKFTGDLQEHRRNPDGPGIDSPPGPALHFDAEAEVVQPPPSPQPVEFLAIAAGGQPMVNVEAALASAMSRLEVKLDLMLADDWVRPKVPSQPRDPGAGEEDLASFDKELERRKNARKVHHNDGFRRMYMMEPTRTKDEDHPHRRSSARSSHREERVAMSLNNQDSPVSIGDSHAKPASPSSQSGLNR